MKNRDKDVDEKWIFKTYLRLFFRNKGMKMKKLHNVYRLPLQFYTTGNPVHILPIYAGTLLPLRA